MAKSLAVLVTNDLTGDSRVLKMCSSATTLGYQVTAFASPAAHIPAYEADLPFRIVRRQSTASDKSVTQKVRGYITSHAADVLRVGMTLLGIDPRRLVALALKKRTRNVCHSFLAGLEELAPDIIHANDADTLTVAFTYAATHPTVAVVYDSHEYVRGVHRPSRGWNDFMLAEESQWITKADSVITVSESIAQLLVDDYHLSQRPLVVTNYPVTEEVTSTSTKTVREVIGLDSNTPLGVYAGAAAASRGLDLVIDLLTAIVDLHMCLVSRRNSYVDGLVAKAERLGLSDRLHILPYVPAAQVTHYLSGATFGFSPLEHHQNHELACPTKLYEYVHAGIPIVTSDVIESARFVTANKVGTVFPARDGQAVVTAVKEVLENPAKYRNSISNEVLQATVWPAQTPVIGAAYERAIAMASQRQD